MIHDTSPIDPSGPGSKTYSAATVPASTCARNADEIGSPVGVALHREARDPRAPRTFGASIGRDPELDVRRLRLVAPAPADRHAVFRDAERAAEPADERQLFERGVRRDEETQRRGAAGGGDALGDLRERVRASRSARACRPRCAAAAAAGGRRLRSSDSRSGRCRTSSSC